MLDWRVEQANVDLASREPALNINGPNFPNEKLGFWRCDPAPLEWTPMIGFRARNGVSREREKTTRFP